MKNLSLGKLVDSLTVKTLLCILGGLVLLFAMAFFALTQFGHGVIPTTSSRSVGFLDCLYFSVVTVSSLGYGDFRPVGFGRVLAGLEVLAGLVFIALFVARIASERTAAYTRLLYSAYAHQALRDYIDELAVRRKQLQEANFEGNDDDRDYAARGLITHLVSLRHFYGYQASVGGMGEDWVRKNSIRTANQVCVLMKEVSESALSSGTRNSTRNRLRKVLQQGLLLIDVICCTHRSESSAKIRRKSESIVLMYENRIAKGYRAPATISPWLKKTVETKLPASPWPKNIDRTISKQIGLSRKITRKTIDSILDDRFPKT